MGKKTLKVRKREQKIAGGGEAFQAKKKEY